MDDVAAQTELERLGRWVEYLNEQREIHMSKITEFEAALTKLKEAMVASVEAREQEKAAWDEERFKYESAIDRSVEQVCQLYATLTGEAPEEAAAPVPASAEPPMDP